MYSGHTRESLMVTSERMAIPDGRYTLGQLLCNLYKRGDQWVDELDDDNLVCTVNGRDAKLFDTIEAGAEICISS
jgi:molybdopterin converting factor small subunit